MISGRVSEMSPHLEASIAQGANATIQSAFNPSDTGPQVGVDRSYGDMAGSPFALPSANHNLCQDACKSTANCVAWSYGYPDCGSDSANPRCWLKRVANGVYGDPCRVSGAFTPAVNTLTFPFGTIINRPYGVSRGAEDIIKLEVEAIVANKTVNVAGLQLSGTAAITYTASTSKTVTSKAVTVNVIEPVLSISKSASPSKDLEAGGVVTYTVTIRHLSTSTSSAFDLYVTDSLLPTLALKNGFVTVNSVSDAQVLVGNGANDTSVSIHINTFNLGDRSIVITYDVVVTTIAISGAVISHPTDLVYVSAPILSNEGNRRNYTASISTSVVTRTPVMSTGFETNIPTSEIPYGSISFGQLVTFTVNISLPQATTQSAVLLVKLPTSTSGKMAVVNATVRFLTPFASSSLGLTTGSVGSASDSNNDQINDVATFNFGSITNPPHVKDANGDFVVVDVVATLAHTPTTVVGQTVTVNYQFNYFTSQSVNINSSTSFTTVGPQMAITKVVSQASNVSAGDVVKYTITLTHVDGAPSASPAYSVLMEDKMSVFLDVIPGSGTSTRGTVTIANNTVFVSIEKYLLGSSPVTITYFATVTYMAEPNNYVRAHAQVTYSSSPPVAANYALLRNLTAVTQTPASFATKLPSFSFGVNSTSIPQTLGNNVAIGEVIFLNANITVPGGSLYNCFLDLTLSPTPGKLAVVPYGAVVHGLPSNIVTSGFVEGGAVNGTDPDRDLVNDRARLTFGTINSYPAIMNQTIVVKFIVLVVEHPANQQGVVLTAKANFTYSNSANQYSMVSATYSFTIVTPVLLVSNIATPNTNVQAGNVVQYNLTIWHAPHSNSVAFSLNIVNFFSIYISLIPGSVTTTVGKIAAGNNETDNHISVIPDTFSAYDGIITIMYKGNLTNRAPPNSLVPDIPTVFYFSSPNNPWNTLDIRGAYPTASVSVCYLPHYPFSFLLIVIFIDFNSSSLWCFHNEYIFCSRNNQPQCHHWGGNDFLRFRHTSLW